MGYIDKDLIWETQKVGVLTGGFQTRMTNTYLKRRQELILVVDNDPCVKDTTRDILERYGHNVLSAGGRGETLAHFQERGKEIAVVLLDTLVLDAGDDFLQQMLAINPAVKVVVTSIYTHGWDLPNVAGMGAAAFLKKPYRMADLLRTIEHVQKIQ